MLSQQLNTEQALNEFAKRVIKHSRANLARDKRKGDLYNSLNYDLDVGPNSFSLKFLMNDYGLFIDEGVSGTKKKYNTQYSFKNKMPPRVDILKWVNRKRLRLRDKDTGRFTKGGQNSLAFLIQRHIFEMGIRPSLFFTKPFNAAFLSLPKELEETYALDVEQLIEQTTDGITS